MDSLLRFASGLSTMEDFAREVYIKSNLTSELDRVVKQLMFENGTNSNNENRILTETPTVLLLCDIIEAIFLHGLKEKLSSRVSSVFNTNSQLRSTLCVDFWPVVLVLCHNEESKHLKNLNNIFTEIGRCRAWLRTALNGSIFRSYFDTLVHDSSLLNGFYRSSAYLRDSEQTDMMRSIILDLDNYIFHLTVDSPDLNVWSNTTLNFLGISITNEDSSLVVTALDAIHLISDDNSKRQLLKPAKDGNRKRPSISFENTDMNVSRDDIEKALTQPNEGVSPVQNTDFNESHSDSGESYGKTETSANEDTECDINIDKENSYSGNSLSVRSGWSTHSMVQDESYNALLESYSTRAALSSTPDINDVRHSIASQTVNSNEKPSRLKKSAQSSSSLTSESDFEIISKNVILNKDVDNKVFFEQLSELPQESGLDEQDYKCNMCTRPIGMIYGKSHLCRFDGRLYCSECHCNDEAIVPAQIIYNWNFRKFPVAKKNKELLLKIETEPIFDIKLLSPLLYSAIPEMGEILDLRTQLFFLHAYLFTCQENIALKMRKLVWPREHLFEHIHLYSVNDLQQVYNNTLAPMLRQVISFARKHISNCDLCKLKGYYCEICKGSEILYPFDTNSTKRCEKCKSVFHSKCYDEKYNKHSCPKCLRIAKKKSQQF